MVFQGVLFEGDFVEDEDMKNLSKAEKKALKAAKRKAQKAKHKAFVLSRDNEDEEQFTDTAVDIERQMEELIEKARSRKNRFISLTDKGKDSKLVHRRKRPKVDTLFSSLFFRRVLATSMTQHRVENTSVHFWTFSPVSVKHLLSIF